jgi:hypothetical protein
VLADPGYQTDLPAAKRRAEPSPQGSDVELPVMASPAVHAASAAAALAQLVLWVLLGVALVLLVIWAASALAGRTKPEKGPDAALPGGGSADRETPWLPGDAARLAGEGRYGEAIHVLLLVAIRQLGQRSPRGLEPSRTSRELIRLVPLAPDGRRSFEALVRTVELTLFGGVAAGAEDYSQSLDHFRTVTGGRL